jgi:ABC-type uncharacterized transport system substrate-binding protein
MNRRQFIAMLAGTTAAPSRLWPSTARAQQTVPVIGFLGSQSHGPMTANRVAGFRQGLFELHYVEGQNVAIEYRWAEGHYDRLPALAEDLVRHHVAVIAAPTQDAALAAKAATAAIPIVFNIGGDPVTSGLVASMNRPGGNVTGVSMFTAELAAKRLGLLHEMLPKAMVVGALINLSNANAESQSKELQVATRLLGLQLHVRNASSDRDFDVAFEDLIQAGARALIVTADPFLANRRDELVALAAKRGLPAMYEWPESVEAGGLMSYGTSIVDAYRQAGVYTGRILKGEKPADMPVIRPVKFELVINLKTAKTLGIEVPPALLARADEVIE